MITEIAAELFLPTWILYLIIFLFGNIHLFQETDVAGVICSGIGYDQFEDGFGKS